MSATSIGALELEIKAKAADFNRALEMAEKRLEHITDAAEKVGKVATIAFGAGAVGIGFAIKRASDYKEALNVLEVAFGNQAASVRAWGEESAKAYGRSRADMVEMAGTIGAVLPAAFGEAKAAISQDLAGLAVDLGSVFNVADSEALAALKSGLLGSTEPLERFGVNLKAAAMQEYAAAQGIKQRVDAMNEAQKMQLRYAMILEQTQDKQGDAIATSDGFANALKRVQGSVDDLAVEFGDALLPYAEDFLAFAADALSWIQNLSPATKAWAAGIAAAATAVAGLVAALSGIALVLPGIMAGFTMMKATVLPLLAPIAAVAAGIAGIILIVGALKRAWDADLGGMRTTLQSWGKTVQKWWKDIVDFFRGAWDSFVNWFIDAGMNIRGTLEGWTPEQTASAKQNARASYDSGPGVADLAADAWDVIKDVGSDAFADLKRTWSAGTGVFKDLAKDALKASGLLGDDLAKATEDVTSKLTGPDGLKDAIDRLSTGGSGGSGFDFDKVDFDVAAELKDTMDQLARDSGVAFERAGTQIGAAAVGIASDLGAAGDILNGFTQGLAQGGPIGAILGVIMAVIQQLEGFGQIMDIMSEDLSILFDGLNEFLVPLVEASQQGSEALRQGFEGLGDIMAQVGEIISSVGAVLAPIHEVSGPALQIVFQALASVVRVVVLAFQWLKNAFLDIAIEFMRFIGNFTNTSQAIEDLQNAKEDMSKEAIEKGFADIWKDTGKDIETKKEIEEGAKAFQRQIAEQIAAAEKAAAKATKSKKLEDLQALVDEIFGQGVANAAKLSDEQQYVVDQVMGKRTADLNRSWDNKWGHLWGKGATALEDFTEKLHDATGALTNVPSGFRVDRLRYNSIDVTGATNPGASAAGGATIVINGVTLNVKDMDDFLRQLQDQQMQQNAAQRGNPMSSSATKSIGARVAF